MAIEVSGVCALLQVFDMPTSLRFYRDVLGFEVVSSSGSGEDFDWGLLQLGPTQLMLNTAYERDRRPPTRDEERDKSHRDVGLFFGCPDVDAAHEHLKKHGLKVDEPVVTDYGMRQLYVTDPDGYVLCFQRPA